MGDCGVDFVLMDRQHGSWGDDCHHCALVAIRSGAAIPMARVLHNDLV